MSHSSWVDTVWTVGTARVRVFGCVRAASGKELTISVIGPSNQRPQGAVILPHTGRRRCAQINVAALLEHWTLVDGVDASAFRGHTRRASPQGG